MSRLEKKSSIQDGTVVDDSTHESIAEKDGADKLDKPKILQYDEVPWWVSR
jgi:hypothetical protein